MRSAQPVRDRSSLQLRLGLLRVDVVREPVKRRGRQRGDDDDPALVRRPDVRDGLRLAAFPTARVEHRRGGRDDGPGDDRRHRPARGRRRGDDGEGGDGEEKEVESAVLAAEWVPHELRVAPEPPSGIGDSPDRGYVERTPDRLAAMTYSIVARDEGTGELGVAVQSRAFGVGMCAWARAGVGAVATQSFTERGYGPRGLDLLAAGESPADALAQLVEADEQRDFRQVAFLAADGSTAAHTGAACIPDCGHTARHHVSAQGNMLASPAVWPAAADTFETAEGPLAERLLAALDAAEEAGGDFRGRESATLLVVSGDRDEKPWQPVVDLRVDNHDEPLRELRRLHGLTAAYRRRRNFDERSDLEEEVEIARTAGLPPDQVALTAALVALKRDDLDTAAAQLKPIADADPRWRETFERHVRLGHLPQAVLDRLG